MTLGTAPAPNALVHPASGPNVRRPVSLAATSRLVHLALTIIALAVLVGACGSSDAGTESAAGERTDTNGRAFLSLEELELLAAPTIVLLQSSSVEGEDDAVTDIAGNPLWKTLPAVDADRVVVLDRLGHPGVEGQIRFFADLAEALG